jgi:protein SDA1
LNLFGSTQSKIHVFFLFFGIVKMGKRNKAELLTSNLAQLQNLIKRDKFSYHEEFLIQYRHFESSLEIFKLKPDTESIDFGEQIMFIAAVFIR